MTFPTSSGHGNFPNGNAFPQIFADQLIENFKENLVASAITNTKYEGDIAEFGDTVRILKENIVTISDYSRGSIIPDQDMDDEEIQLLIDQGKAFSFTLDDIERRLSHVDWAGAQMDRASFDLRKAVDTDILEIMRDNGSTNSDLGTNGAAKTIGFDAGDDFTPLNYIAKGAQILDENDVPESDRWVAATPAFYNALAQEESSLVDASVIGTQSVILNPNLATSRMLHGFQMFKTTNMPTSAAGDALVMFGHISSTSTATALIKTKTQDVQQTFGERMMGVIAYGRKVIRDEALFIGHASL